MADEPFGQWGTVSFAIPDFLDTVRDAINDFAELLITFLEVANQALEFAKAFIKGYLDPLTVLIEAIIAEIMALLQTFKGIGLYLTGDWGLLGWPPEDLRGGFQGYERRMIARLTDRTDPTRPDVPSTTKVVSFFSYMSVDPSDFERLYNFVLTLMKMFGISYPADTSRFPVPLIKSVHYGIKAIEEGATGFQFAPLGTALSSWDGTPPQKASLSWVAQPASMKHPMNPFPQLGPSGYIITVSTIPEGISLKYARARASTDKKPANGDLDKQVQPQEYGDVRDVNGVPLKLYGGAEMLDFKDSAFEFNAGILVKLGGSLKDGYARVFGKLDPASNEILSLEHLGPACSALGVPGDGRGAEFFLQRTFLITDGVTLAQWFAGEYTAVFDVKDMPHHAEWAMLPDGKLHRTDLGRVSVYYVRVWSVGKQVADEKVVPQWDFKTPVYQAATAGQPFVVNLKSGAASLGNPSQVRKVTFVGADTQEFLRALQTALLVLVLTRADMPYLDEIEPLKGKDTVQKYKDGKWAAQGFALKATGLEDARGLLQRLYSDPKVLEMAGQDAVKWRGDLYNRIRVLSLEIYAKMGTNARVEKYVVQAAQNLLNATWSDVVMDGMSNQQWALWNAAAYAHTKGDRSKERLLDGLNPGSPIGKLPDFGLAPNIYSTGLDPNDVDELFYLSKDILYGQKDEFVLYDGGSLPLVFEVKDPAKVRALLRVTPAGLANVYRKFVQADGSLNVPDEFRAFLTAKKKAQRVSSSGELTPVFMVDRQALIKLDKDSTPEAPMPGVGFMRGGLRMALSKGPQGQTLQPLITEAALVLKITSAERAPGDGEWIALRLFDTWPALEEFLRALENWVKALMAATQAMADAIIKYIEFIQAQIVELQQLIKRINALLQSFLGFTFALPQFSGLMLYSDGTDGVLADLVAAKNKPSDTPLSYGAGIALVVPFAPGFIMDIIKVATATGDEPATQDLDGTTSVTRPPPAVGIEAKQPANPPPDDDPL